MKKKSVAIVLCILGLLLLNKKKKDESKTAASAAKSGAAQKQEAARPKLSGLSIAVPETFSDEDVFGYACAKNLSGLLDTVDSWTAKVNPEMPAGTAKMSAGQYFGDPTMAGLDSSRQMAILFLNPKKYSTVAVLYVPVTDASKMKDGIEQRGGLTVLRDNILVVADENETIMKGVALLPKVQPLMSKTPDADIVVSLDVENLMKIFGDDMKQKIKDLKTQMNVMQMQEQSAEQMKMVEAQIDEAIKFVEEIKTIAFKADAKSDSLEISAMCEAKKGTDLERLMQVTNVPPQSMVKFLPDGGIKISVCGDYYSLSEIGNQIGERLMSKSGAMDKQQIETMKKITALKKEAIAGEAAICLFIPSGQGGLNGAIFYKVKDAAKALELIRMAKEQLMLRNASADVTTTVDYAEKARQAEGVDVHTMDISISSTNPMATQQMAMFIPGGKLNMEMAIVKDVMIYSIGTTIDPFIKTVKEDGGSNQIAAFKDFPAGAQVYGDLDVAKTVKTLMTPMFAAMSALMSPEQNPLTALDKVIAPPVTFTAMIADGKASGKIKISLDTILKMQESLKGLGIK